MKIFFAVDVVQQRFLRFVGEVHAGRHRNGDHVRAAGRVVRVPFPESCGTSPCSYNQSRMKARPAMTKLSGMFDLIRILDLQRPCGQITRLIQKPAGRESVGVRPQKASLRSTPDAKRVAVKLQRNAAAKVEFKVKVAELVCSQYAGVVSVIAREVPQRPDVNACWMCSPLRFVLAAASSAALRRGRPQRKKPG